jgi:hypothetical protein
MAGKIAVINPDRRSDPSATAAQIETLCIGNQAGSFKPYEVKAPSSMLRGLTAKRCPRENPCSPSTQASSRAGLFSDALAQRAESSAAHRGRKQNRAKYAVVLDVCPSLSRRGILGAALCHGGANGVKIVFSAQRGLADGIQGNLGDKGRVLE